VEVPHGRPYCSCTAAALAVISASETKPCMTVVAPPAASCFKMPAPMPVVLPAGVRARAGGGRAVGGGGGRQEAAVLSARPPGRHPLYPEPGQAH
jgi:hypothetical protein